MKKKYSYIIIFTVSLVAIFISLTKTKIEIFKSISNGDNKESVLQKMGDSYIVATDFYKFSDDNFLTEVYCWEERKFEIRQKDNFPYFSKINILKNYTVQFKNQKVINLEEIHGLKSFKNLSKSN